MKTLKFLSILAIATLTITSCNEDDPCVESTFFQDADGDGFGNSANTLSACDQPEGYVDNSDDVDDTDASCNSNTTFYEDADGDGLGNPESTAEGCSAPDGFVANSDDNDDTQALAAVVSGAVSDLNAPQIGGQGQGEISGEFTKFDFETQSTTDSDTDWDIAFRGTTIIVNGGVSQGSTDEPDRTGEAAAYIVSDALFDEVTTVDEALFVQDAVEVLAIPSGSDNGWYNYNFMTNVISPLAGKVLVFRTTAGVYAKIEILSYYQGAPAEPDGFVDTPRYYSFNYAYQPNNGIADFTTGVE